MTEKQAVEIFAWFSLIYGSFLIVTCLVLPLMSEVQVRVAVFCAVVVSGFFGWRLGRLFHRTTAFANAPIGQASPSTTQHWRARG